MNPSTNNQPDPGSPGATGAVQNLPYTPPQINPAGLPMSPDAYKQPVVQPAQPLPPAQPTMQPAPPQAFVPSPPPAAPVAPPAPAPLAPPSAAVTSGSMGGPEPKAAAAKGASNSTQNTLQIAEIRDGIVIMNDGSFRSVVMVKSINFDLMSLQEQEAVEFSYQGFLNSLYFPIQIFLRSQRIDLQPYIEKLDKIRTEHDNMLLALLMEDYIGYIDGLSQQTNIMDKKFYVVIPFWPAVDAQKAAKQSLNFFKGLGDIFSPKEKKVTINEADLENAKTELRNRVQAVLSGLLQCGIQGLPLDTQELIELYYDTYNPDTATRQELKNFNELSADVITKGQGAAPQSHLQRELQ